MVTSYSQKSDGSVIGVAPIEITARRALAENWRVSATQTGPAPRDRGARTGLSAQKDRASSRPPRLSSAGTAALFRLSFNAGHVTGLR
jgi:hypothetical protein